MERDTRERIRKAKNKALENLDYVLETIPKPDFVVIVGRAGGDIVAYRVYDDGSMYSQVIIARVANGQELQVAYRDRERLQAA